MCLIPTLPKLKIYLQLEEDLCELLEQSGLSYAAARQIAKAANGLLRGLKKSISHLQRLYFPEFSVKDVLKYINRLKKCFRQVNKALLERIQKSWDKRRRVFVICDDYMIPRWAKKAYRIGYFRDPVVKKIRLGHNVVDTVIATGGIEITMDFALQPKNARIKKTGRAREQLLRALSHLHAHGTPKARIRVAMDGGYTNSTVLPALRERGIKYLGTARRDKLCTMFGEKQRINTVFPANPSSYLTVSGTAYYYDVKTLNLTDWGRHQVFQVWWAGENEVKFYLTNDLKMTAPTFLKCQRERWWIEQSHRDLKQFCGVKQLFVRKKRPVEGRIALSYLLKNVLAMLIAEAGLTMREYPIETLVEKEFCQVDQFLIQSALNSGVLEELEVC